MTNSAKAEYRVYELVITDTTTGKSRTVASTLDNLQYRDYYPVKLAETVEIQDTWMCWPRTDYYKRLCPNPKTSSAK